MVQIWIPVDPAVQSRKADALDDMAKTESSQMLRIEFREPNCYDVYILVEHEAELLEMLHHMASVDASERMRAFLGRKARAAALLPKYSAVDEAPRMSVSQLIAVLGGIATAHVVYTSLRPTKLVLDVDAKRQPSVTASSLQAKLPTNALITKCTRENSYRVLCTAPPETLSAARTRGRAWSKLVPCVDRNLMTSLRLPTQCKLESQVRTFAVCSAAELRNYVPFCGTVALPQNKLGPSAVAPPCIGAFLQRLKFPEEFRVKEYKRDNPTRWHAVETWLCTGFSKAQCPFQCTTLARDGVAFALTPAPTVAHRAAGKWCLRGRRFSDGTEDVSAFCFKCNPFWVIALSQRENCK